MLSEAHQVQKQCREVLGFGYIARKGWGTGVSGDPLAFHMGSRGRERNMIVALWI